MIDQIEEIAKTSAKDLIALFTELHKAREDRDRYYHNFSQYETGEALDKLREELLEHLAANIVVKENKDRYQKE